jgi:hypothetical protein
MRFIAWTWVVLAVLFMATGGKPYYLAGLLPALLGAGAVWVDEWLEHGRRGIRTAALAGAIGLSAVIGGVISLPVLSEEDSDPVIDVNEDVGETIGWPEFTRTVAEVYRGLPDRERAVVLAGNYGEAGAIDRYGPDHGLPRAHSGHNAYADWGEPPDGSAPVIAVGFDRTDLSKRFRDCIEATRIDNGLDVDNDEQGTPVFVCAAPRRPWSVEWPELRHLG